MALLQQLVSMFTCCDFLMIVVALSMWAIIFCRRRNTESRFDPKFSYGNGKEIGGNNKKIGDKLGGSSLGGRSAESTEVGSDSDKLSACGTDTDESSVRLRARRSSCANGAGLSGPPPGLDLLVAHHAAHQKHIVNEAKVFVPETHSKHKLEECLRDISASHENDLAPNLGGVLKRQLQRQQNEHPQNGHPPSLDNVLSRLIAEDAKATEVSRTTKPPWSERFPSRANAAANLKKLAEVDPKRIFMVRRIKELGLNSPEILERYFSQFGLVEKVYVSHSIDKRHCDGNPQAQPIVLPAGYGYIVMEKVDDVVNIFQHGLRHTIQDVPVPVTAYEHHLPDAVGRKEPNVGIPSPNPHLNKAHGPRFPSYANITEDNTFQMNMRRIAEIDERRIFMVRRINKLGFGSAEMLKTHFEKIGAVTNVFVTHNLDKRRLDQTNSNPRANVRPAGLGFVVMETAEDLAAVFRVGTEQTVFNEKIYIFPFEHRKQAEVSNAKKWSMTMV